MSDSSRFISAVLQIASPTENSKTNMVVGKVTSVSPLKIKVGKIELTETFLVVGALCKSTTIKIPQRVENKHKHVILEHQTGDASDGVAHTHTIAEMETEEALPEILLWRGLQVNDEVYMFRMSDGQQYYIHQRKEGIT